MLHRVIHVREKDYLIRGDNTYCLETVPEEAVIGVLTGFTRKGKQQDATGKRYRIYSRLWCAIYPFRAVLVLTWRNMKALLKNMGFRRPRKHE